MYYVMHIISSIFKVLNNCKKMFNAILLSNTGNFMWNLNPFHPKSFISRIKG